MKRNSRFTLSFVQPRVVGTGLVALDVVYSQNQPEPIGRWAGGTCGNVLSILSWLGCSAWPVARLQEGNEASAVRKDLKRWGVNLEFVTEEAAGSTPIILQYIHRKEDGQVFHRFKMRCPVCGNRLPSFRPVTGAAVAEMTPRLPEADVFYFDRTSRGILDLAAHYYGMGAVIVFEPSGVGEQRHFDQALEMAHVVKFADDRIDGSHVSLPDNYPSLHIETKGRNGLRYRCRFERYRTLSWQEVPALSLPNVRDAAGAGDWCTAGLIYHLGQGGVEAFKRKRKADFLSTIHFSQALSAWNCRFEGARGGMYVTSYDDFTDEVVNILDGELDVEPASFDSAGAAEDFACAACQST
jgi:fructokinase